MICCFNVRISRDQLASNQDPVREPILLLYIFKYISKIYLNV